MEREDAIEYLENLQQGEFLTVNIPIIADQKYELLQCMLEKTKTEDITL